jgi:hypothetical protein
VVAEGRPWEVMGDAQAMERAHLEPTDAYRLWGGETGRAELNTQGNGP